MNARKSSCWVNSQFPGDEGLMRSRKGKPCVQAIPTLLSMVCMVLKEQCFFSIVLKSTHIANIHLRQKG